MGTQYTAPSISNYNDDPPTDDGSQTTANEITWAGIKAELADPVKNYAQAISSATSTAFTNTPSVITKYKTADTSRNTTTTLADDTHLYGWTLAADTVYKITGYIVYTSGTTPDIKFGFQTDQTPQSGYWISSSSGVPTTIGTTPGENTLSGNGADASTYIHGLIHVHATLATTLDFQWAQNTSDAGNTTIYKGSWISVEALGTA